LYNQLSLSPLFEKSIDASIHLFRSFADIRNSADLCRKAFSAAASGRPVFSEGSFTILIP
jgi:hypothetical protein